MQSQQEGQRHGRRELGAALRHVQRLLSEGSCTGLSDTQLLSRFATRGDEAAFATLVARHGPMVLSVCRGVLHDPADAEDAFQATFLVLAKKAAAAWAEGQLGGWLHKVAFRIAVRTRADARRRRRVEERAAENAIVTALRPNLDDDLRPALHEEIARLPANLRLPIVLCYMEGLTHNHAAAQLRCGEATLRRRLAGARERLRLRLVQRGFAPAGAAIAASLAEVASASMPPGSVKGVTRAAIRIAAGEAMTTVVSRRVAGLTHGGLSMIVNGSKVIAFAFLSLAAVATLASGVGATDDKRPHSPQVAAAPSATADTQKPEIEPAGTTLKPMAPAPANKSEASESWPMTISDAMRIALENCRILRIVSSRADRVPIGGFDPARREVAQADQKSDSSVIVIAQVNQDTTPWHFKSDLLAHCRTVEQQYWNLAAAHAHLWSAEQAVRMGQEILDRRASCAQNWPRYGRRRRRGIPAARAVHTRPDDANV